MVYNTRNYWVFGLWTWSGTKKQRTQRSGNWTCFRPQERGGGDTVLSSIENHLTTYVSITTAV
jgi:hypothetical protein